MFLWLSKFESPAEGTLTEDGQPKPEMARRAPAERVNIVSPQRFEDDIVAGFRIPAKSLVVISPYVAHRHPEFWSNPEGFDPERFLPERSSDRPRFAYFPFSGGPRVCIGLEFAMLEAQIVLAMTMQRYRLDLVPGQLCLPDPIFTLRPKGGVVMSIEPV